MHSSNLIEHGNITIYYLARTKHDCIPARCIFDGNTSVAGHKQGAFGFSQRKPLPRLIENFSVIVIS